MDSVNAKGEQPPGGFLAATYRAHIRVLEAEVSRLAEVNGVLLAACNRVLAYACDEKHTVATDDAVLKVVAEAVDRANGVNTTTPTE